MHDPNSCMLRNKTEIETNLMQDYIFRRDNCFNETIYYTKEIIFLMNLYQDIGYGVPNIAKYKVRCTKIPCWLDV